MTEKTQSRFKSPVFWSAIAAQIVSALVYLDIIDVGASDALRTCVCAALELLVAFGILNNPTNGAGL